MGRRRDETSSEDDESSTSDSDSEYSSSDDSRGSTSSASSSSVDLDSNSESEDDGNYEVGFWQSLRAVLPWTEEGKEVKTHGIDCVHRSVLAYDSVMFTAKSVEQWRYQKVLLLAKLRCP